ncbi:alpha/beta fold hydrolase [Rhodococcus pyridinivorans]|uniref:alpha/beta fold hydrolase n=1 Tax=Rhodococcus pyridinivorans TaxID=103816 RepID=UPI003D7F57D6
MTRYIQRDGAALAYQIVGEGPHPIAWFFEDMMHPDLMWTDPHFHYNFERCARFARSLFFQRRGFGLSDPVEHVPTLEEQADDVVAVLDDAEVDRATLVGAASTCGPLALVAARHPDRVSGLVLAEPWSDTLLSDGDPPPGWTADERDRFVDSYRDAYACWGQGKLTSLAHPTLDVPHNRRIMALLERCSATPRTAQKHLEWALRANYSLILPAIQCPTKVLHQPDTLFAREAGRRMAAQIPNGRFYELPPIALGSTLGEVLIPVLDHVEELVSGTDHPVEADRFLGAVLFTDVVRSTDLLAEVGDNRFARLLGARPTRARGGRGRRRHAGGHRGRWDPQCLRRSSGRTAVRAPDHPIDIDSRNLCALRRACRVGDPHRSRVDRNDGPYRSADRCLLRAWRGAMLTGGARACGRRRFRFHRPGQASAQRCARSGPGVQGDGRGPSCTACAATTPDRLGPGSIDHGAPGSRHAS